MVLLEVLLSPSPQGLPEAGVTRQGKGARTELRPEVPVLCPQPLALGPLPGRPVAGNWSQPLLSPTGQAGTTLPGWGWGCIGKAKAEGGGEGGSGRLWGGSPSSRSLGQSLGRLDFSAEELPVERGEGGLDHDGVEVLEGLQLLHVLAAQAPQLPLGRQLEAGQRDGGWGAQRSPQSPQPLRPSRVRGPSPSCFLSVPLAFVDRPDPTRAQGQVCVRREQTSG